MPYWRRNGLNRSLVRGAEDRVQILGVGRGLVQAQQDALDGGDMLVGLLEENGAEIGRVAKRAGTGTGCRHYAARPCALSR